MALRGDCVAGNITHCVMYRDTVCKAEVKARCCEAETSHFQSALAEAQAELADSRSRLAQISDSHTTELAMRASMAAHQENALAKEHAANAKLCAHIQELKASLLALEARRETCPLGLSPLISTMHTMLRRL